MTALLLTACMAGWEISEPDAIAIARRHTQSSVPPRVLEVRSGTFRDLYSGPSVCSGGGVSREDGERLYARPVWLVVLVGMYRGNCPPGCPQEEGREELLIDAETGDIRARLVTPGAPGGIVPPPDDLPCGDDESCGP